MLLTRASAPLKQLSTSSSTLNSFSCYSSGTTKRSLVIARNSFTRRVVETRIASQTPNLKRWNFSYATEADIAPEDEQTNDAAATTDSKQEGDSKRAALKEQKKRERKERLLLIKQKRQTMLERSRGPKQPRQPNASAPAPAAQAAAATPAGDKKKGAKAADEAEELDQVAEDADEEPSAPAASPAPALTPEALAKMTPAERRSHLRRAKREAKEAASLRSERAANNRLDPLEDDLELPPYLKHIMQVQLARERARKAHLQQQ